jgi:hypothetical protein
MISRKKAAKARRSQTCIFYRKIENELTHLRSERICETRMNRPLDSKYNHPFLCVVKYHTRVRPVVGTLWVVGTGLVGQQRVVHATVEVSIALVSLTTCDPNCGRKENRTVMPSSAKMALHGGLLVDRFARGGARDDKNNQLDPAQVECKPMGRNLSRIKNSNELLARYIGQLKTGRKRKRERKRCRRQVRKQLRVRLDEGSTVYQAGPYHRSRVLGRQLPTRWRKCYWPAFT